MMTRILLGVAVLLTVGCGTAVYETAAEKTASIIIEADALAEQPMCAEEVGQVVRCKTVAQFRTWIGQP